MNKGACIHEGKCTHEHEYTSVHANVDTQTHTHTHTHTHTCILHKPCKIFSCEVGTAWRPAGTVGKLSSTRGDFNIVEL